MYTCKTTYVVFSIFKQFHEEIFKTILNTV